MNPWYPMKSQNTCTHALQRTHLSSTTRPTKRTPDQHFHQTRHHRLAPLMRMGLPPFINNALTANTIGPVKHKGSTDAVRNDASPGVIP